MTKLNWWKPHVGQRVRMSAGGYEKLHLKSAAEFMDSRNLVITRVENIGRDDEPIWSIDVDKPSIDRFMLDATMFEPIPEGK